MKKIKKALSLLLVLAMVLTLLPASVLANPDEPAVAAESVEIAPADDAAIDAVPAETDIPGSSIEAGDIIDETVPEEPEEYPAEIDIDAAVPALAAAQPQAVTMDTITKTQSVPLDTSKFYTIFHLDCGRNYFSVQQIKNIIDEMAKDGYNTLELAVGNDALRLVLDDMSVTANGTTYASTTVKNAITSANRSYRNNGTNELTQSEMDTIIAYANSKNIAIIPLVNAPGHANSILAALRAVGISNPSYASDPRTIDVRNAEAVNFTLALVNKYIQYFAVKGCKIFNMGADEYANTSYGSGSMGFGHLQSEGEYGYYADFVNNMAAQIQNAGMTAMAFNDGIYFNNQTTSTFDKDIAIAYWSGGWGDYVLMSAADLAAKGHKIINTNDGWYYVMGRATGGYSYDSSIKAAKSTKVTDIPNPVNASYNYKDPAASGAMVCLWYDESATYSETNTLKLISTLAENNADYFTPYTEPETPVDPEPETPVDPEPETPETPETPTGMVEKTIDLTVGETKTDVQEGSYSGSYPTADTSIATATVTTGTSAGTPGTEGKATKVTSVSNGEYILGNGSQWIVLNADGTIGSTTDAAKATKWTVTKSGSSYTFKSGSTYLGVGTTTIPGSYNSADKVKYSTVASSDNNDYTSTNYYHLVDGQYYPVYYTRIKSGGWLGIGATTTYTLYYKNGTDYVQFASGTNGNTTVQLYTKGQDSTQTGLAGLTSSYNWSLSSSYGFNNGSNYIRYNNGWTLGSRSSSADAFTYSYTPGTDAIPGGPITTASFKGVSEGTTTVTIGNVHYTINVADKAPTGALTSSNLTLEYWITNYTVHKTTSSSSASSATIPSSAATSNDGVAITDYAPEQAYSFFDGTVTVYYWQSMRLDSNNKQTSAADDDETSDGTTFTRVRYHGGAWQYKTLDGAWHYFLSTDQAVAYYMQKTSVTKEVDTMMKDWGWGPDNQDGVPHVALSVGVVYPDGTLSPSEANLLSTSTTFFNLPSGKTRDIGIVAPVINDDYEIEKITYTYGVRTNGTAAKWSVSDGVTWNKTTTAAGSTWFDETEVWNDTMGTTPMVNGKVSGIIWNKANTGYLILIYLKPIHHDTNLTVKWVDDTANVTITSQEVVVDYTGSTAPTFITDIYNNGKKGASAGTIDLKDDAYIINKAGVHQTFNKDLTVMPNIPGQYTSGLYKYVSADISADGKTLTLHYTMDASKLSNNYVVDFGLGVDVPLSDFGITNVTNISKITTTSNATYANGTITFKPAAVMNGVETVTARVEYKTGTPQTLNIGFIPASSVYYEEGYATMTGFSGGSKGSAKQAKQVAGSSSDEYGYDVAYATNAGASAGSEAVSNAKGDVASLPFTGTGIDLYVNCGPTTGTVTAQVKDASGKSVKMAVINTKADGVYGAEVSSASYNTKIVAIKELPYGNYTLKLTATTANVKLDGFRVYGTLADQANKAYTDDKEDNPSFLQMRNAVLTAITAATTDSASVYAQVFEETNGVMNGAVVTDVNSTDSTAAETMLKDGPKNELYLAAGQALTFKVTTNRKVQIGLKAPNGATKYTVNNGTAQNITSSVDMFYTINSGTVTIKNTGSKVLSVTDLKVCDAPAVLGELTESDIATAIAAVNAPVVENADATVNVKLADYTGKAVASTAITVNGVVGETATVAAADIQAAAQAVLPAGYGIVDVKADVTVAFGETADVTVTAGKVATLNITYKKGSKKVGTATLTAVQTSKTTSYTFSSSEIKAAGPAGYTVISIAGTSVKFGSSKSLNATCL